MSTGGPESAVVVDGRFELRRQLGEGAQAVVWAVRDRRLNADRAMKVMLPNLARNERLRARFEGEARAMAVLEHPNVVRIYDVAECNDAVYFVMERVRGGSLVDRVARGGPLPPRLAVETALQVCQGAAAAHAVGIIHRDIKPHNVLLAHDGTAKLVDFGIARTGEGHRTMAHAAMGTYGFMAPEQVEDARSVDVRADVFSIGMTLFVAMAGTDPSYWLRHRSHPRIPEPVARVIARATEDEPARRYPDVAALADALREALRDLPADPPGPGLVDRRDAGDDDPSPLMLRREVAAWFERQAPPTPEPTPDTTPPSASSASGSVRPVATYFMPRVDAPRPSTEERPSWLAETPPPRTRQGFDVTLDQEERAGSQDARVRRTVDAEPGSASGRRPDAAESRRGVAIPWSVVLPVAALLLIGGVGLGGWTLVTQREAAQRRATAESVLTRQLMDDRDLIGTLDSLGADGVGLDDLYRSWESERDLARKATLAAQLVRRLHEEADGVLISGSTTETTVRTTLRGLDAALAEYDATH